MRAETSLEKIQKVKSIQNVVKLDKVIDIMPIDDDLAEKIKKEVSE